MKIPISTYWGVRWGSALTCAFLAAGALSARADLQDGLVANFSFETIEDVEFPRDGGSLKGKGVIGKSPVPGIGSVPMIGKTWSGGGKADNPEALDDHELTAPELVPGKIGQAVTFGDSFYLESDWNNEEIVELFNFGAPDDPTGFTISAWLSVDQFSKSWQAAVAKGEENQWRVHRRGDGLTITGNGGNGDTPDGQQDISDGEWYHVVLRSNVADDQASFWVNGVMEAENSGLAPQGNIMPMMIGQNPDTGDRTWDGKIDEVAMWNRPLTDAEIDQLYNGGSGFSLGRNPTIELDFNADPAGTFQTVNNGGNEAEWRATGGVDDSGYFSITDSENGTYNVLIFDDITEGLALRGFDFRVDLRVGGGTDRPADGFSLNLVTPEDPLLQDPIGQGFAGTLDLGATEENLPEEGSQTGLGIGLDAWVSGGIDVVGISVRVDGTLVDQFEMPTLNGEADDPTSLQTGPQNLDDPANPTGKLTWQTFRAFLEPDTNKLTIQWKGETLMDGVVVPWAPTSVRPIFAARTGGANQNHHIDNFYLEMVPARLASLSARVRGKQLVITGGNGPESDFDAASLVVKLDLDGDGTQETIDVGTGVVDGTRRTYTYDPPASFFEPESSHTYTVTAVDSLGNALKAEGVWEIAPTNTFSGGFLTTRHVWTDGDQIGDAEVARSAINGDLSLRGDITVKHPYAHFHDNAAAPIQADLSIPYPLWAEPDQIPDDLIVAGERIGGGVGDRDDYAILTTGEFFIREGGNILFVVNSDDGFDLLIDGESIGQAGNRGRGNTVMEKNLDAGTHTVELIHWERGGGAGVSLYVSRAPDMGAPDAVAVNADNFEVLSGFNIHDVSTEDTDGDGMDDFKETFFFGNLSRDGSGDFDSDGLSDGQELALRADPTVKDSDGDGLEDGREVNDLNTNPASVDTDGDGLADGREVNDLKTDPTKADTDDDTFGDNVELALGNDPLDANNKPDAIIAVANGSWNDPLTWSDGQAPSAGKKYVAVGTVTKKIISSQGAFGGDSLTLIGPNMTLELAHNGAALANLTLNDANIVAKGDVGLGGTLAIRGNVHVAVGANDVALSSRLTGGGHLTFQGGSATDFQGSVDLTGTGSTFGGPMDVIGTDVAGLSEGSLTSGSILLASGGVAYGYDYSSDLSILKIQGDNFRLVFGGTTQIADIHGVDADGNLLFSLNDLAGPGPYTADDLLGAFQLDEGISGAGTIELLGLGADTDGDGLADSWENEHFGNLNATAEGDPDGDGLTNLAEQSDGTDPNVPDVIIVDPVGPDDVTQPGDAIVLVNGENDGDTAGGPPPGAEGVENVINNTAQKYLNFLDLGSGFIVTPGAGATTVSGIRFYPANDAVERDPASFTLEGSPVGADGPWVVLARGPLALPEARNAAGLEIAPTLPNQTVFFVNTNAYLSYRVTFPTLKDAEAANSMQIAEVELLGDLGGTLGEIPDADNLGVDLVAYYPLDGHLRDLVGTSHGTGKSWSGGGKGNQPELLANHPAANLVYADGAFGQAVDLNGAAGQYIETPLENEDLFDFGAPDNPTGFTVSAWFRVDSFTKGWQALIAKGEENQWRIHRQGTESNLVGNGGAGDIAQGQAGVNDGALHHIVLVSDPDEGVVRLYIDGELREEGAAPSLEDNPMPMMIGQNPDTDNRTWDGLIDEVAIWSRPLGESEVLAVSSSVVSLGEILGLDGGGPVDPGGRPAGISVVTKSAGEVSLSFAAGTTYDVEYSADLQTWTVIATDVTGVYQDTDAARAGAASGYYRGVAK